VAHSLTRADSMRRAWASKSPEERQAHARNARRALAVREIVDGWPELTEEQQQRLRSLLRPVPEVQGGGRDG
jgi:hypothetical protein